MDRIYLSPPNISNEEFNSVKKALDSNYVAPVGPQVNQFEREFSEYTGVKNCLAVSSGTAAMHLALRAIGCKPNDEVIASTLTFIGSVSPVTFLGSKPIFIDSDYTTWNMDPALLEETLYNSFKRGKLPKAVVPTDLYGQCCDYKRIFEICENYKVPVIVDSAEADGAKYRWNNNHNNKTRSIHSGKNARIAIYSFNGNKILTTSGGGMLASDDKKILDYARYLSQQAREGLPHYEHMEIGYNYRMSNILAAIGSAQLKNLDCRLSKKREIYNYYKKALGDIQGIEIMPKAAYSIPNHWLTVILLSPDKFGADREVVRIALKKENIESRPIWKPMHLQPAFFIQSKMTNGAPKTPNSFPAEIVGCRVSEDIFLSGLCLPSGTSMNKTELDRVIDIILNCQNLHK